MDKTRCNDVLKVEADLAVARRFSLQGKTNQALFLIAHTIERVLNFTVM